MKRTILFALVLATLPALAQAPQPVITELQSTKLELYTTKIDNIIQRANEVLTPLQQQRQALIQEIQTANPGWTYQVDKWVKLPPAAKTEAPAAKPAQSEVKPAPKPAVEPKK